MIVYKGYIMNTANDFVEEARKFDDEFAEALDSFLTEMEDRVEELQEELELERYLEDEYEDDLK